MHHPVTSVSVLPCYIRKPLTISDLILASGAKSTSGNRHFSGSTNPTVMLWKFLTRDELKPSAGSAFLAASFSKTSVAAAKSLTDLAIGQMLSKVEDPSQVPSNGILPGVVLIENKAARVAGWMHDPSVSVPSAIGA